MILKYDIAMFCVTAALGKLSSPHRLPLKDKADWYPGVNERGDVLLSDEKAPYKLHLYRQQEDGYEEVWSQPSPKGKRYHKAISLQSIFLQKNTDKDTLQLSIKSPLQVSRSLQHKGELIGCCGEYPVYACKENAKNYYLSIKRDKEEELILRPPQGDS